MSAAVLDAIVASIPRSHARPAPLLSVHIQVDYPGRPSAVAGIDFEMPPGEILGLVGASGSGKSTIALALMNLLKFRGGTVRGSVRLRGRELTNLSEREMRTIRGRDIALIPQSPVAALNPALRIGTQLNEAWRAHAASGQPGETGFAPVLESVCLPADREFLARYPGQLSVGQAQRLLIAMAVLHEPALLIADEPTSALDVVTQSEILDLLRRLNRTRSVSILFISHDLLSVASLCDRVGILHEGRIVETAPVSSVFASPRHPYTRRLIAAIPKPLAL